MFKIVQNIEGRYYSSNPSTEQIYSFLEDGRAIEYKIGEWEVKNPSSEGYCPFWSGFIVDDYINEGPRIIVDNQLKYFYPHTIFADAVKLVKRIL